MQCFPRCACEGMFFKPSLQVLLIGGCKAEEALLEIPGIPLLSAQRKQILISQPLNQAVLSSLIVSYYTKQCILCIASV